jgi:NADH-dependent peroxiredoxin subunit F
MQEIDEIVKIIDTVNHEAKSIPVEKSKKALIAPEGGSFDSIIIGGGPAGMTAGIFLARKKIKTLLISPDLGGQVNWTNDVENYPGYNIITGIELARAIEEHLQMHSIYLFLGDRVTSLELKTGGGMVTTEKGANYSFSTLISASGKRTKQLGIPGEREFIGHGVSYCATCDVPLYRGDAVAVIGGGNSALSAAIDLLALGNTVYLVNCEPGIQSDKILIEKALSSKLITLYVNHSVVTITGNETVSSLTIRDNVTGEMRTIPVSGVFVEIGLIPNSQYAKDILAMNEMNEILVDCYCKTSVPGIFAAGDVTSVPEKQIIIAAGEGAKAALSASNYLIHKAR